MSDALQLCEAFFDATGSGDADGLRAVCAPSFQGSQNGGPAMTLDMLIAFSQAVAKALPDFHYENPVRNSTEQGFVEEHDVCCTLPAGDSLRVRLCVVGEIVDGKIVAVREYADSAQASGLINALSR